MTATRLLAFVFVAAAIVFLTVMVPGLDQQASTGSGGFYSVGPAALPTFAGVMVLLLGVIIIITDRPTTNEAVNFGEGIGFGLLQIGLFSFFAIGLTYIGFLPASILFLAATFVLYRAKSWIVALILTLTVPILVDLLLREVFLVPLPGASFF